MSDTNKYQEGINMPEEERNSETAETISKDSAKRFIVSELRIADKILTDRKTILKLFLELTELLGEPFNLKAFEADPFQFLIDNGLEELAEAFKNLKGHGLIDALGGFKRFAELIDNGDLSVDNLEHFFFGIDPDTLTNPLNHASCYATTEEETSEITWEDIMVVVKSVQGATALTSLEYGLSTGSVIGITLGAVGTAAALIVAIAEYAKAKEKAKNKKAEEEKPKTNDDDDDGDNGDTADDDDDGDTEDDDEGRPDPTDDDAYGNISAIAAAFENMLKQKQLQEAIKAIGNRPDQPDPHPLDEKTRGLADALTSELLRNRWFRWLFAEGWAKFKQPGAVDPLPDEVDGPDLVMRVLDKAARDSVLSRLAWGSGDICPHPLGGDTGGTDPEGPLGPTPGGPEPGPVPDPVLAMRRAPSGNLKSDMKRLNIAIAKAMKNQLQKEMVDTVTMGGKISAGDLLKIIDQAMTPRYIGVQKTNRIKNNDSPAQTKNMP